jgi:hypothetical protein
MTNREQLLNATREAAAAFVEDMPHIRGVSKRAKERIDPDKGELRRLSNELRRLLVDGDLQSVAAPRIGRFTLLSPDNAPVLKATRKTPFPFFQSGGVAAFGVISRAIIVDEGISRTLEDFDPDRTVALPMDNFLTQKVLCLKGKWATRRDVIKYMANIASGVHSGAPKEDVHLLLNRIRHAAKYSIVAVPKNVSGKEGEIGMSVAFNVNVLGVEELPFAYNAKNIDPVLIELLAAAHFLTSSPDMITLETIITEELNSGGH